MKNMPPIYDSEYDLMEFIWLMAPVKMRDLCFAGYEAREWKRTTVYTMVTRLAQRGLVTFENGVVTPNYSKKQVQQYKTLEFIDRFYEDDMEELMDVMFYKNKLKMSDAKVMREKLDNYIGKKK